METKQMKTVYNIDWFDKDGDWIEGTQLDEIGDEFVWEMFKEFGHERLINDYYEYQEVQEEVEEYV